MSIPRIVLCVLVSLVCSDVVLSSTRRYHVNRTPSLPVIDGMVAPGEWDSVSEANSFSLLRELEGTPDEQNWRFKAIWNDDGLYMLFTSDYGGWVEGHNSGDVIECGDVLNCGGSNFGGNPDSLNLFFDPNLDDRPNEGPANGYLIAIGLNRGNSYYRDGVISNTFVFQEAHVDASFGNQGQWGSGANEGHTLWSFEANVDDNGGVIELELPWDTFDAPHDRVLVDGPPDVPSWYFNAGVISSDPGNFLPVWRWNPSQSFVTRPDGELVFFHVDPFCLFDDGVCDEHDIDRMTQRILNGQLTPADRTAFITSDWPDGLNTWIGDSNLDGQFDELDFVQVFVAGKYVTGERAGWAEGDWDGNLLFDDQDFVAAFDAGGYLRGHRSTAVPEPSGWVLTCIAFVCFSARCGSCRAGDQ